MNILHTVDQLLRDPKSFLSEASREGGSAQMARTLVLIVLVGAAVFGASLGLYRGGLQVLYSAVKLPIVLLLTVGLCAPVLTCTRRALGLESVFRRDLVLVLATLALTSLVLAAMCPLVLLGLVREMPYHSLILMAVGASAVAAGVGFVIFFRGLTDRDSFGRVFVSVALLATFALCGSQMAWTLRPYLVRPRTLQPPIVRTLEGGFLDSVGQSLRSAMGDYHRSAAPLPEEVE